MPYLIDGHNLIGRLPDVSLDEPDDEAKLVQKLSGFVARTRKRCVVVFDEGLPGGESRMSTHAVKVIFASSQRTNADLVMMSRIRKARDPTAWTIVSSDNEVLNTARQHHMKTLTSAEFASMLQRPESTQPGMDEAADVHLSPEEVEKWLKIFGGDED